jgi:hypothetical protein
MIAIRGASIVSAFQFAPYEHLSPHPNHHGSPFMCPSASSQNHNKTTPTLGTSLPRRSLLATALLPATLTLPSHADDFESIANRAAAAQLQENAASAKDKQ